MRLLLDTHTFLWLMGEPEKLSPTAIGACKDRSNVLYLSLVSVWEIQIKLQLGKLELDAPLSEILRTVTDSNQLELLAIDLPHILALDSLPAHHRDPFDRLLITQARALEIPLVTKDRAISQYPVDVVW